jgi:hypothetical protein
MSHHVLGSVSDLIKEVERGRERCTAAYDRLAKRYAGVGEQQIRTDTG